MHRAAPTGYAWSRRTWGRRHGADRTRAVRNTGGLCLALRGSGTPERRLRTGGHRCHLDADCRAVGLVYLALVGLLALLGVIFLWRRSRWGPRLLIPSNLLSMAVFYLSPFSSDGRSGHAEWAVALVLFASAPAVAVGLLLWALLSSGSWKVRIVELVVLAVIALPSVSGWSVGLGVDFAAALAPTSPPVVAAAPSCTAPAAAALTRR